MKYLGAIIAVCFVLGSLVAMVAGAPMFAIWLMLIAIFGKGL